MRVEYLVERKVPYTAAALWKVLKNVRHYSYNDPFHHDFKWVSTQRTGVGTAFNFRHTYAPIFPFASDVVTCTITRWEPKRRQTLVEKNNRSYRSHAQDIILEERGDHTIIKYKIAYLGIPAWVFPLSQWVQWQVKKRMENKLKDIEHLCARGQRQTSDRLFRA